MEATQDGLEEMGPIDYLVVEWPGKQPTGEAAPYLLDLVERGIIRILDLTFITKDEDGTVSGIEIDELGESVEELKVFSGVSSGLISDDDTIEAAQALEPGTSAALLVFENAWAGPVRLRGQALGRPARRQRPDPDAGSPRGARRARGERVETGPGRIERGRPMPGLIRGVARTAVVAGTATAVSGRVQRRQNAKWAEQEAAQQQQYAEPAPAAAPQKDNLAQLKELGELRDSGVLTDAEFEAQKAKILAG